MEDDIDILLDEVETKYCLDRRQRFSATEKKSPFSSEDSLSEVINDICNTPEPPAYKDNELDLSAKKDSKRCHIPYLGGTALAFGISTGNIQRACHSLHCISCDFRVSVFDGCMWDNDIDYYFFRDSAPDFNKLCSKLLAKQGSRAYACQCQWRSITTAVNVEDEGLPWVCGKH
ncbi:cilia- and flagella-associated protein 418-like isoform X2 [Ornithodoros turicata]|uniref:cilia- and flagella-associated protein 418-like isoform X2 n=1 Tax=Ornithodoros turicata TaxID=34597 RepID=UPI003139DE83